MTIIRHLPIAILSLLLVYILALAPKGIVPFTLLISLFCAIDLWRRKQFSVPEFTLLWKLYFAFLGFAAVSLLWSIAPAQTAATFTKLILLSLMPIILLTFIHKTPRARLDYYANILFWVVLSACLFSFFVSVFRGEFLTLIRAMGIAYDTNNQLFSIQFGHFEQMSNKSVTLVFSLALVMLACLHNHKRKQYALALMTVLMVLVSTTESVKLALAVAVLAFLMAKISVPFTKYVYIFVMLIGTVLIVPVMQSDLQAQLDTLPALEFVKEAHISERLVIYKDYAELAAQKPLLGHGGDIATLLAAKEGQGQHYHPHNIILQIIYEFGFLGAGLFLLFFARAMRQIAAQDSAVAIWGFTAIAGTFASGQFAFDMWQSWQLTLWVLVAAGLSYSFKISRNFT